MDVKGEGTSAGRKRATTRTIANAGKRAASSTTTSTQPKTRLAQAQELAERAILVPVGASLLARDNLVSTVKGLTTKYRNRAGVERELKRYERRGVTARNRFERQVRKTRTGFERELRQRRTRVERTVKQNRRRLEREVRSMRVDLDKQSTRLAARVEKLFGDAQRPGSDSAVTAAKWLTVNLGEDFTAYVSAADHENVSQWYDGEEPGSDQSRRLLLAYHAGRVLVDAYDGDTALAWFFGSNRFLGDESPAWLIRHSDDETTLEVIVSAAHDFALSAAHDFARVVS